MSEVVDFKRAPPPYEPPKSIFGDDEYLLKWCAEWRATRAQQQKNWAEHEAATMWGTVPDLDIELDLKPLRRMKELETHLAQVQPRTMVLARELLGIAVTILAYEGEDPEGTLARGPVLDIVRNVVRSLEYCESALCIGRPKRDQQDG